MCRLAGATFCKVMVSPAMSVITVLAPEAAALASDILVQEQTVIDLDHVLARLKINDRVVAERRLEDKGVVAAQAPKNVIVAVTRYRVVEI